MKQRTRKHSNLLRCIAGWCGLLLYAGVLSPVGMGAMALLGTMDPDHHAMLEPGAEEIRLVLHHEGNCASHHHGAVARALTMFAQPPTATDPDHVLQFGSATSFLRESQRVIAAESQPTASAPIFSEAICFDSAVLQHFALPPRPPPHSSGTLLNTRFTVFLI